MFTLAKTWNIDGIRRHDGLASEAEIQREESFGNIHFVHRGDSYFFNVYDEYEKEKVQNLIGVPDYKWFREATGDKHWVLYNPEHYHIDKNWEGNNILKINKNIPEGAILEVPINASSLSGLFSWVKLSPNVKLTKKFKLDNIKDLSLMFSGCTMYPGFSLGENFDTSHVEYMRYMFYNCNFTPDFQFGDLFHTDNVKNIEYMFAESTIPAHFSLTDNFSTRSIQDMNHMFFNANFCGTFDFGASFAVTDSMVINDMFVGTTYQKKILETRLEFEAVRTFLR
jgi:hypothetical protein